MFVFRAFGKISKELIRVVTFKRPIQTQQSTMSTVQLTLEAQSVLVRMEHVIPSLTKGHHKGQAGRVGVIGGSLEYTGAPYFSAISALKVGADLVHVFCVQSAAPIIKSYSPELIVHPLLDCDNPVQTIEPWLDRLHVLVIGPGLGRDEQVLNVVAELIKVCKRMNKPLIIDADGLHLITMHKDLLTDYEHFILTPNTIEFNRLINTVDISTIKGTLLKKGEIDSIYTNDGNRRECLTGGSGRRCGGQGDLLSGALAIFYYWTLNGNDPEPSYTASFAATFLTKQCNAFAFKKYGRSTTTTDMINEIHNVFETYFEKF